jgi:hypothetical protein
MRGFRSLRDGRRRPSRSRGVLALIAVVSLAAGCGGSSTATPATPPAQAANAGATTQPVPATAAASDVAGGGGTGTGAIMVDQDHEVTLVNLHLAAAAGGPAYDVYQVPQDVTGLTPIVSGLAYGTASPAIHPGRAASASGDYGLSVAASGTTDATPLAPIQGTWKQKVVALTGSGPAVGGLDFFPDTGDSNVLPAATPDKVTLVASAEFVGDPNAGGAPQPGSVMFGVVGGPCLPSSDPNYSGDAADPARQLTPYTVPAGSASVGFWISSAAQPGPGDCSGAPVAQADTSSLAAGSRALVFFFGPTVANAKALVLPVP